MKKLSKIFPFLLAFFLPVLLFFLVFHLQSGGLWPFGENTILTIDAEGQYVPFFAYLRSVVFGNNDFFYSFQNVLGGDAFGFSAYYLFSPFNIVYLLVSTETTAFLIVTLLKIGAMGLFAFIFLTKHFKQKPSYKTVVFSTSYAICLYSVAFYSNTMFLDGLVWLPLIWLGIDRLLETGKMRLYVLSLATVLCAQYYMAYMLCIGAALYFIYMFLTSHTAWGEIKRHVFQIRRFAVASVVSALISLAVTLPTFISLLSSQRFVDPSYIQLRLIQYSPIAPILQFFGIPVGNRLHSLYGSPFVFCGIAIAVLATLYFVCRRIKLRKKILSGAFIAVFLISFSCQPLDYIWHALSIPNGFIFRYSFILSFFLIICAYEYFLNLPDKKILQSRLFLFSAALVNFAGLLAMDIYITHNTVTDGAHYIRNHEEFNSNAATIRKAVDALDGQDPVDRAVYRVEKSFQYTENDPMLYGYNGLTHYSSSSQSSTMSFVADRLYFMKMERLGLATVYKNTMTASIDNLFGIKYFFNDEIYDNGVERGVDVFRNNYALPLGFMAHKDLLSANTEGLKYFRLQNKIFESLSGVDAPIFTVADLPIKTENLYSRSLADGGVIYTTVNKNEPGYLYVDALPDDDKLYYFDFVWHKDLEVRLNNEFFPFAFDDLTGDVPEPPMLLTEKYVPATEIPQLEIGIPETLTVKPNPFWQESKEAIGKHYAALADEPCELNKITSSHLTCTVTAKEDGNLFFSIPNDKGWVVKVDGKKVKTETAFELFMTFPLMAGTHNIEMKYTPRGLWAGFFVSLITAVCCIVFGARKFWKQTADLCAAAVLRRK